MKSLKISILVFVSMVAACFIGIGKVQAQEFTIQGDLVSSYAVSYTHLTLPTT